MILSKLVTIRANAIKSALVCLQAFFVSPIVGAETFAWMLFQVALVIAIKTVSQGLSASAQSITESVIRTNAEAATHSYHSKSCRQSKARMHWPKIFSLWRGSLSRDLVLLWEGCVPIQRYPKDSWVKEYSQPSQLSVIRLLDCSQWTRSRKMN